MQIRNLDNLTKWQLESICHLYPSCGAQPSIRMDKKYFDGGENAIA